MRMLLPFILTVDLLIGCGGPAGHSGTPQPSWKNASDVELLGVLFKEGRPRAGDSLLESVVDADISRFALEHDARIIKRVPQLRFYVVGASDPEECGGEGCNALSRRRARLVHEWLLGNGILSSAMETPVGVGSSRPLTDNSTEAARTVNRRAYIDFVWPAQRGE